MSKAKAKPEQKSITRYFSVADTELFEMFTIETSKGEDLWFSEPYSTGGSVVENRDASAYLSQKAGGEQMFNQSIMARVDDLRGFYESSERPFPTGERDAAGELILDKETNKPKMMTLELSAFDWGF